MEIHDRLHCLQTLTSLQNNVFAFQGNYDKKHLTFIFFLLFEDLVHHQISAGIETIIFVSIISIIKKGVSHKHVKGHISSKNNIMVLCIQTLSPWQLCTYFPKWLLLYCIQMFYFVCIYNSLLFNFMKYINIKLYIIYILYNYIKLYNYKHIYTVYIYIYNTYCI